MQDHHRRILSSTFLFPSISVTIAWVHHTISMQSQRSPSGGWLRDASCTEVRVVSFFKCRFEIYYIKNKKFKNLKIKINYKKTTHFAWKGSKASLWTLNWCFVCPRAHFDAKLEVCIGFALPKLLGRLSGAKAMLYLLWPKLCHFPGPTKTSYSCGFLN